MITCSVESCDSEFWLLFSVKAVTFLKWISYIGHFVVFATLLLILLTLKKYHVMEYEIRGKSMMKFGLFLGIYYSIHLFTY